MEKSKLIEVLKTFETSEFKRFEEFCLSPYFNKSKPLAQLCIELRKLHPEFSSKSVAKEKLFSKLFAKEKYVDQRMRDLISGLYKLCELYISVNNLRNDSFRQKLDVLKTFQQKSLIKYFEAEYESAKGILEENKETDVFYNRFLLESEKLKFTEDHELDTERKILTKADRTYVPYDEVTAWYLQKTLTLHTTELNLSKQIEQKTFKEFDKAFFDKLIKTLPDYKNYFDPYFLLINFLSTKDEKLFPLLITLVDSEELNLFSSEDQMLFFKILVNYCIQKAHAGDHSFNIHHFDLCTILCKKKLHVTKGRMDTNFFSNYVFQGLVINNVEGIVDFINENAKYLDDDIREDTVNFCFMLYYYHEKDFKTALRYYNKVNPEKTFYGKIDLRLLLIKIYYELGDYESLLTTIDSFRHLFDEKENYPEQKKDLYLKMAAFIRTLGGIGLHPSEKDRPTLLLLKEKVDVQLGARGIWLTKKIESLLENI